MTSRERRDWTTEERERLEAAVAAGWSAAAIGEEFGRTASSIRAQAYALHHDLGHQLMVNSRGDQKVRTQKRTRAEEIDAMKSAIGALTQLLEELAMAFAQHKLECRETHASLNRAMVDLVNDDGRLVGVAVEERLDAKIAYLTKEVDALRRDLGALQQRPVNDPLAAFRRLYKEG